MNSFFHIMWVLFNCFILYTYIYIYIYIFVLHFLHGQVTLMPKQVNVKPWSHSRATKGVNMFGGPYFQKPKPGTINHFRGKNPLLKLAQGRADGRAVDVTTSSHSCHHDSATTRHVVVFHSLGELSFLLNELMCD